MVALPCLAAVSFVMKIVAALFVLSAVLLILIILIQKGRGGGLSAAFGGGGGGGILGSKTGDFLTWVTIVMACAFLCLAVIMAKFYRDPVGDEGAIADTSAEITEVNEPPAVEVEPTTPNVPTEGDAVPAEDTEAPAATMDTIDEEESPVGQ
ncbi:preprotein translocase subunit SecG [Planctomycetota bacterium]